MKTSSPRIDVLEQSFSILEHSPENDDRFLSEELAEESSLDGRFVASEFGPIESVDPEFRKSLRRTRMFCFECNRQEGHSIAGENRFVFSFLVGLTLGLIYIVGPYICQCCGAQRLFRFDNLNPFYWFQSAKQIRSSSGRRRRRRTPR